MYLVIIIISLLLVTKVIPQVGVFVRLDTFLVIFLFTVVSRGFLLLIELRLLSRLTDTLNSSQFKNMINSLRVYNVTFTLLYIVFIVIALKVLNFECMYAYFLPVNDLPKSSCVNSHSKGSLVLIFIKLLRFGPMPISVSVLTMP